LKIVVVGAGSSYTPELFASLTAGVRRLDVEEIALVDLNPERLEFIADVGRRILDLAGSTTRLTMTTDLDQAVEGADFVIPQIRVGGLAARKRDETLPMTFGLIGNETTGAGGFVCALRTIPAVLRIARTVERRAPDAWILNLSNPAGIVTEALLRHSPLRAIGFCNIPTNTARQLGGILGVDHARLRLDSFGLNHLSWLRGASLDGEDMLQPLFDELFDGEHPLMAMVDPLMQVEDLRALRLIPSWYVRFFYFTEQILADDLASTTTKADRDVAAEERLAEIFRTIGFNDEAREILAGKGGANYYENVLAAIDAIANDTGEVIVADVRNNGAIPDLPDDACVEVPARIDRRGATAQPVGDLPVPVRGLIQGVKAYEELTIQAAVAGDRARAIQALVANPIVRSYPSARRFFEQVLENEREYLQPFLDAQAGRGRPGEVISPTNRLSTPG
jgi:6-phospho-beta-glucosidase